VNAKGCFTQDKFIAGRTLQQIEKILGFKAGRLVNGGQVYALTQLPRKGQFRVAGYTNVSLHRFAMQPGLDSNVLERNAMEQWTLTGPNRLVKVVPKIPHQSSLSNDEQYPHAAGAPQWEILTELPCKLVGELGGYPNGTYRPTVP
jgi:hypothetical protein